MSKTLEVAEIKAHGNRIEYLLRDESGLGLFKEKSLTAWIEFHNAEYFGFEAETVPEAILAVPIALYLYPATWFYAVDLALPTIDKTLDGSLDAIYAIYSSATGPFKPEWRGKVCPAKIEENPMPAASFERLVFFSDGVDAVHAAINNAGAKTVLASVPSIEWLVKDKNKSADEAGKDFLEAKSRIVRTFSEVSKSPWILITNNFNADIFNNARIFPDFKEKFPLFGEGINWFTLKHLANMTSAAPFAWSLGIRTLVMGSAYEPLEGMHIWANDTTGNNDISKEIKFSDVSFAEHDGLYTRRSQKVRNIVSAPCVKDYKSAGQREIALRTCFSDSTVQCGKCKKCVRTQLDLLAAGEDPREWGFALFDEKEFSRLVRSWGYVDSPSWLWDIMDSIKEEKEYPYCNEMLHWLKRIGWREYTRRAERRKKDRILMLKALRIVKVHRYPHYAAVVAKKMFSR